MVTDRTGINSLNSLIVNTQEPLSGTRNLAQQDTQTPSHFINEETMSTTTQQKFVLFILHLLHRIITILCFYRQLSNQQ